MYDDVMFLFFVFVRLLLMYCDVKDIFVIVKDIWRIFVVCWLLRIVKDFFFLLLMYCDVKDFFWGDC